MGTLPRGESKTALFTLAEAAGMLGVEHGTLSRQVRRGVLQAEKLGSFYVVSRGEIERYRAEHLGKHGFASPGHPLHGKRGGGRRAKEPTP